MNDYLIKHVYIDDQIIQYKLIFKNVKNLNMRIIDNQIVVSAPINVSNLAIENFVNKYIRKMNNYLSKKQQQELLNIDKNIITIFNKKYSLKVIKSLKNSYKIIGRVIYLNLNSIENKKNLIKKIYKDLCNKKLIERTKYFAKEFNLIVNSISTKWMTTKWGYCIKNKKQIVLALQLGAYKQEIIDYVIIHELMHLIQANHSQKFWELVEQKIPNYKNIKKRLNNFDSL